MGHYGETLKTLTSSVAFQDELGNILAKGSIIITLPPGVYLIASGGGQVIGQSVIINLDATGKIPATSIWASDELSPQSAYNVTLCAQANGLQPVSSAQWFIGGVSPIDLSLMTPSVTGPSYSGAVVLNPGAQQTINGQPLVLENAQLGFSAVGSTSGDIWLSRMSAGVIGLGTVTGGVDGRLRMDNGTTQSSPVLSVRRGGTFANAIEFGHTTSTGFGSNIGSESSSGQPFIAFCSEAGTNANTYRTRGNTASIIRATTSGLIQFGSVANANADNQAFANAVQINTVNGTITASSVQQSAGTSFSLLDPNGISHFFISSSPPYTNTFINGSGSGVIFLGSAAKTSVADTTGYITMSGSTSGTVQIQPSAAASGTVILPNGGTLAVGIPNKQIFTSGGTFTIPAGVTALKVSVVGAGGAGGGATTTANASGTGGFGGGAAVKWLSGLTPGNTLTVAVGTGGTGVANGAGNSGGNSSVSSGTQTISTITGSGGGGGATTGNIVLFSGGTATGGDQNITGGSPTSMLVNYCNAGSVGGTSIFSGGGAGGFTGAGVAGTNPGAGGGGAGGGAGGTVAGGAGANGIVIFEWAT